MSAGSTAGFLRGGVQNPQTRRKKLTGNNRCRRNNPIRLPASCSSQCPAMETTPRSSNSSSRRRVRFDADIDTDAATTLPIPSSASASTSGGVRHRPSPPSTVDTPSPSSVSANYNSGSKCSNSSPGISRVLFHTLSSATPPAYHSTSSVIEEDPAAAAGGYIDDIGSKTGWQKGYYNSNAVLRGGLVMLVATTVLAVVSISANSKHGI